MLEAQRRFDLLAQRATPDVIEASIEHARTLYGHEQADPQLAAHFRAAAETLASDGTNADDPRRAWAMLRQRVCDERMSVRLTQISDVLVLGATSGGEVSAATFAFPDDSYLILTDQGLATLTWLTAQLHVVSRRTPLLGHPPPADPVDPTAAAQTLRLATSRIAGGGRAGVNPSLILGRDELALAGALVREMDIFVLAHEAAHILLEHFDDDRTAMGIVGGPNRLLGRRAHEEAAADLLGITLQLDDVLSAGEGDDGVITLRLTAVRLFLALLELYERSMFVVQPTSHPPAADRWRIIVDERLSRWLDDVDEPDLEPDIDLVKALQSLDATPRHIDAAAADRGLGDRLDRALWDLNDWSQTATLGHYLIPTASEAISALSRWPGWPDWSDDADTNTDANTNIGIEAEIAKLVTTVLSSEPAREIVRAAALGTRTISRLAAAEALTNEVEIARRETPDHIEPFPSWAIAGIALDAIADTMTTTRRADSTR